MRVRSILIFAFLVVALIPASIFGWWAYQDGIKREFSEVSDRHLVLAKNLGRAMQRYHIDLVAISESVSNAMIAWEGFPKIEKILHDLNIDYIVQVDRKTGRIISKLENKPTSLTSLPKPLIAKLSKIATKSKTTFSQVMASKDGTNIMYAVKLHGNYLAVTRITTKYFDELGKSISFGIKGHAAIVDSAGNVLAHPLPSWVKVRKNISKVSAVKRMLAGETGIQQFYSPALKGDMIAGFTAVSGPGWGVMIPQPVSELYDKAAVANNSIFVAIALGVLLSVLFATLLINFFAGPMSEVMRVLQENTENKKLSQIQLPNSKLKISELTKFRDSYNGMVEKIGVADDELKLLAYTDNVTGLPNRARFHQISEEVIQNPDTAGSLIFVDIDDFKVVNDLFGHAAGDKLLERFATKISAAVSKFVKTNSSLTANPGDITPFVSRIGGDEFTILVPGLVETELVSKFLDILLKEIQFQDGDREYMIDCHASIGCARYPLDANTVPNLMRCADIAMYRAKHLGKNKAQIYTTNIGKLTENEIRAEFSKAIEKDQLVLEYQPKICTRRKAVYGVEALVRWNHPKFGLMSPGDWIPAISNSSLIVDLGNWVIETAMCAQRAWQEQGVDLKVAVNVSSRQLIDQDLPKILAQNLKKFGINSASFEIEVTEDSLFANEEIATKTLSQIKETGVMISIDDFGKGYSNLSRFAQLPIDFIKLDRSIVTAGLADPKVKIIIDATVSMAKNLDCKIVAEGVETLELAHFATDIGANLLQGFYFSRSMPADQVIDWVEDKCLDTIDIYKINVEKLAA